jgi:hypothetical protein
VTALGQAWAVTRMELRRSVSWRSLWVIVMAFAPVIIIAAHALEDHSHRLDDETLVLNGIVQIYYVRCGIFFGCLGIFLRLVRGEVAERTLHYLFLAPVRREALLVGKFVAGVITTVLVFGTGVLSSFLLMFGHFPAGRALLAQGPAWPICASTSSWWCWLVSAMAPCSSPSASSSGTPSCPPWSSWSGKASTAPCPPGSST